jgi:hypothetical protein
VSDFVYDNLGWVVFIMIVVLTGAGMKVLKHIDDVRIAWMKECVKDHKEYECIAIWRNGGSEIIPFPIIIPMGR